MKNKEHLKLLTKTQREIKQLEDYKMRILYAMSDPEKAERLLQAVISIHEGILDSDDRILDSVIQDVFDGDEDLIEWYKSNKNTRFYKSAEVFDMFTDHPVQKAMVKDKSIGKRGIKKSKTANQHIDHVHQAKHIHLLKLENQQQKEDTDRLRSEMNFRLERIEDSINKLNSDSEGLTRDVDYLVDMVGDDRKVVAYRYKQGNPNTTNQQLADHFNVSKRTIIRWVSQVRDMLEE